MTIHTYDPSGGEGTIPRGTAGSVYATTDTTFSTPLAITPAGGSPGTVLTSGPGGILPGFTVADHAAVVWRAGNFSATLSASVPTSSLDATIAALVADPESDLAAGLSSTYAALAHASRHGAAGADPITITEAQVTGLEADLASKATTPLLVGRYYSQEGVGGSATVVQDKVYYAPMRIPRAATLDRIGVEVQTGVASATVRLGIFADNSGTPGALILDAGTIDASTSDTKDIAISQAVSAGVVWLAAVSQGAAATLQNIGGSGRYIGKLSASVGGNTTAYTQAGVTGALPSVATIANTDYAIRIYIRASA